jgi:hypothetical protein
MGRKQPSAAVDVKVERALQMLAVTGSRQLAAKAAGVRPEQVSRWLGAEANRKRVHQLIDEAMEPARLAWAALVVRAIERASELLESEDEVIAERTMRTVLDRHKEFAPHQHQHDATAYTAEQLRARFDAAMAKLEGKEPKT